MHYYFQWGDFNPPNPLTYACDISVSIFLPSNTNLQTKTAHFLCFILNNALFSANPRYCGFYNFP